MANKFDIVIRKEIADAIADPNARWPVTSMPNGCDLDPTKEYAALSIEPDMAAELVEAIVRGASDATAISSHFTSVLSANPKP